MDTIFAAAAAVLGTKTPAATQMALTDGLASGICATDTKYCNGTNAQYLNSTACYKYMTEDIRFGEAYEPKSNTLLCRMVHQDMVPLRPDVHYPHIGPTGGGMCDDNMSLVDTVENNYFKTSFIPEKLLH